MITGETLCDEKAPVILERMDFPDPVIKIAIEPKSKGDLEKMVGWPPSVFGRRVLLAHGSSFSRAQANEGDLEKMAGPKGSRPG